MLLSQVLEPVVVEIAPEPDGPQDEDRPVLHPRTAAVGAADPIDILGDGIEQGITQGGPGVNVLQGCQDGDDLVSAGGVEPDVEDGCAVESQLGIEGDSHGRGPRRFPRSGAGNWLFRGNSYARSPHSSRGSSVENPGKDRLKHVLRRPLASAALPWPRVVPPGEDGPRTRRDPGRPPPGITHLTW